MCCHEDDNPYDMFSIKVCKPGEDAHLPIEISRITHFILQRGATVSRNICGKHYWGSPLVQGRFEVPYQITVCMSGSVVNHWLLSRYETLLRNLYIEPKDDKIMGTFLSLTKEPMRECEPPHPQRKKNKKKSSWIKGIRLIFLPISTERQTGHDGKTVVIDWLWKRLN